MQRPTTTTERLEAFSDGVFAVAITLLVLDLHVDAPPGHLVHGLLAEWPGYATYVISFVTIGIIWVNHHSQFERVRTVDRGLMFLNLILLLMVTAIPFPTGLLAKYLRSGADQHAAAIVYAATLLAMALAFFSTYLWCIHKNLFEHWIDDASRRYLVRRNLLGVAIYVVAIAAGFASAPLCLALCAAVAVYYMFPGRV